MPRRVLISLATIGSLVILLCGTLTYQNGTILERLRIIAELTWPAAITVTNMGEITFSKTLPDGTLVEATYHQREGESYSDFRRRALAEWQELCESLGG